jgi:hypothetical protein
MTDFDILQKVIQKAEKNGFDRGMIDCYDVWDIPPFLYVRFLMCEDFAKAFWKDEICWMENLRDMVTYKNSLKYLERYL